LKLLAIFKLVLIDLLYIGRSCKLQYSFAVNIIENKPMMWCFSMGGKFSMLCSCIRLLAHARDYVWWDVADCCECVFCCPLYCGRPASMYRPCNG